MVFIVKFPRGQPGSQSSLSPQPEAQPDEGQGEAQALESPPLSDEQASSVAAALIQKEVNALEGADPMHSGSSGPASEPFSSTSNTASQPPPVNAPAASGTLDILVAPPVLNHRFVRSRDMRTIVERPERIRAVLLGVAGACARGQITETVLPESAQAVGTSDPGADLADVLAKLSVASSKGSPLFEAPTSSGHIGAYVSSRHLSLTRDNAVNYVHAHEEEEVERTLPEYASAATVVKEEQGTDKAPASSAPLSSHAAYLAELCALAPSSSPVSTAQRGTSAPSTPSKAAHVTHAMASAPNLRDTADPRPSEVPAQLPQGDLYLRGGESGTRAAIEAALGTSAEAVDRVVTAACATTSSPSAQGPLPSPRAFAIVRPPGHHCSGSLPGGFCWVNNVAVAAAHGYLEHGIDRAIILDFDLHHGNGTQALAWRINSDTVRIDLENEARMAAERTRLADLARAQARASGKGVKGRRSGGATAPTPVADDDDVGEAKQTQNAVAQPKRGLKIFYGSLHDIESYPCEDGTPELVRDASTCIAGAHGQWIWNVHLETWTDHADFHAIYERKYATLFDQARQFVRQTDARPEKTIVLLSAGFDACMHEYPSMQRHGKSVPVSFYARFSADARNLADEVASGKCVSVLEGGYSDRALTSAAMAHCAGLAGLADGRPASEREWWDVESLIQLEKMAKRKAAASTSTSQTNRRKAPTEPTWLTRASKIFNILENASDPESAGGKDESRSVAGAGLTSGSSGGVGMGTSPTSERVLRDRAAIRARPAYDQTTTPAAQSPPQRRAATATAAGGARRGGAAVGGGAGGAKATEKQKETDEVPTGATEVDMRTTEPTFEPETSELPPPGPPAALVNVETPHAYAHAHLPTSTSTQDETQPAAPPTLSTTATETQIGGQPHIKAEAGADTQDELATHMASLDIRRGAGSESEAVPAFASERALGSTSAIGTGAGHDSTSAQAQASAPSATTTES